MFMLMSVAWLNPQVIKKNKNIWKWPRNSVCESEGIGRNGERTRERRLMSMIRMYYRHL